MFSKYRAPRIGDADLWPPSRPHRHLCTITVDMRQARSYTSQYGTPETTSHAVAAMKQMRRLLVPGIVAALSSCGGSNAVTAPPDPLANVIGTYALTAISDSSVLRDFPQSDAGHIRLLPGTLVLRDNNTFTLRETYLYTYVIPGTPLQFAKGLGTGTYTVSGSSITLNSFDGRNETSTGVVGDALTLNAPDGSVYTYQKV